MSTIEYDGTQDLSNAVVRFTAEWCGPCKAYAPLFDRLSEKREDTEFVVVDIDSHSDVAREWGIKSIPALFEFGEQRKDVIAWTREQLRS